MYCIVLTCVLSCPALLSPDMDLATSNMPASWLLLVSLSLLSSSLSLSLLLFLVRRGLREGEEEGAATLALAVGLAVAVLLSLLSFVLLSFFLLLLWLLLVLSSSLVKKSLTAEGSSPTLVRPGRRMRGVTSGCGCVARRGYNKSCREGR